MSTIVRLILFCYFQNVVSSEEEKGYICIDKNGSHKICHVSLPQVCESDIHALEQGICSGHCQFTYCHEAPSLDSASIPEPKIVRTVTYSNRTGGEISRQECIQVSKTFFTNYPYIFLEYVNSTQCDTVKLAVSGGTPTLKGEFPHMALIGYRTGIEVDWACGGSLISKQFVLTAAHCLNDVERGTAKFVRLGITDRMDYEDLQEIAIDELIFYPHYKDTQLYHDIGLIKLSKCAKLGRSVRPACLHIESNIPFEKVVVTGWGNTRPSTSSVGSDVLLRADLEFFDVQKCNTTFKREIHGKYSTLENGIIDDLMICAGSTNEIRDSCKGDSGGPLQAYYEKPDEIKCMHDVLGIVSTGKLCGLAPNVPGIYTRVSAYIKWIEDIVWPE